VLTAWSNDFGYENVFARQVEAFGQPGDVLLGISTSGRSRNLIHAFQAAREHGMRCIALLGAGGGDIRPLADVAITVPTDDTQHIQEVQIVLIHLLCELVEEQLLANQRRQPATTATVSPARNLWALPPVVGSDSRNGQTQSRKRRAGLG
jgi:DNA-binding MurR/RpiR family transcriptional regulator